MSDWGGSSNNSYARWVTDHASDSEDDMWRARHQQRKRDEDKRAYFGVICPMSNIASPENSPRAMLPRDVVRNLLADPRNNIMTFDSNFIEDIISSALTYGMPLFFNSWNCAWCADEGEATLIRAPPRRPPSNSDWTQTGFFSCLGYE